jgi:hypothetical protein
MKTNNILSKCQSGFQPNDSTVNQLIEIYHNIISNMDKLNKCLNIIFSIIVHTMLVTDIGR